MNYRKNDYELIYMVRENDEYARDMLYEKYFPIIKSLANEFFQMYNGYGYDFDDFMQEALVAFQNALINYDENRSVMFYTFVTVCMRRSLLSFCRRISNKKRNTADRNFVSIDNYENVFRDDKADLEKITNIGEVEKLSKELMFSLPFESGCIFELRYNGFSYKEISILLDIPISSVEFKNRCAKKKFYRLVKKYYLEKAI